MTELRTLLNILNNSRTWEDMSYLLRSGSHGWHGWWTNYPVSWQIMTTSFDLPGMIWPSRYGFGFDGDCSFFECHLSESSYILIQNHSWPNAPSRFRPKTSNTTRHRTVHLGLFLSYVFELLSRSLCRNLGCNVWASGLWLLRGHTLVFKFSIPVFCTLTGL